MHLVRFESSTDSRLNSHGDVAEDTPNNCGVLRETSQPGYWVMRNIELVQVPLSWCGYAIL